MLPGSVTIQSGGHVTADLLDKVTGVGLVLELGLLQDHQLHLVIAEKSPLRPRYRVKDVVVGEPELAEIQAHREGDGWTSFEVGSSKVVLNHAPFRLEVFVGGVLVMRSNGRGLLNLEQSAGPAAEQFEEHVDTNPFGHRAISLDFDFYDSHGIYGIPERATSLSLSPTMGPGITSGPHRMFNADVYAYPLQSTLGIYGSIPFVMSAGTGPSVGLLWLNASETWMDISQESSTLSRLLGRPSRRTNVHWMSETGVIEVYLFLGPKPGDVVRQHTALTGRPELPPLFSIAYHQCRWNYDSEADVEGVDSGFDAHNIPYDVLWLDIEHTDAKKYFTWDPIHFPTPLRMQATLAEKGRKMVTIVDPHIKREQGYYVFDEALEGDLFVKNKSGKVYQGECWPGNSSWIDFTNPKAREWWASKYSLDNYRGSTLNLFIWNDMNEPAVFGGPEKSFPRDNVHHGGWEHRDMHNQYGFYQHMATHAGLLARDPTQRPMVLSRSFFAGSQRFGPIWTGDSGATWKYLAASNAMLLSLNLSGFQFCGGDVGGFVGNPDSELLVRWYQSGAFQPFFRGHANRGTIRREPWLKGEPFTTYIRDAIRLRYTLLPLWYTLFHDTSLNGSPILRPLFMEFPETRVAYGREQEFLVGTHLLVVPVTIPGVTEVTVFLPGAQEIWYDFFTLERYQGGAPEIVSAPLGKIPVFIRGGAVIPKKETPRKSSALMTKDPLTLLVALDRYGRAAGDVYQDDGQSFDYRKGDFSWKRISFADNCESVPRAHFRRAPSHPPPSVIML